MTRRWRCGSCGESVETPGVVPPDGWGWGRDGSQRCPTHLALERGARLLPSGHPVGCLCPVDTARREAERLRAG